MFNFKEVLKNLKFINKSDFYFYNDLLKMPQDEFINYLDIFSTKDMQMSIRLALKKDKGFEGIREWTDEWLWKHFWDDDEYEDVKEMEKKEQENINFIVYDCFDTYRKINNCVNKVNCTIADKLKEPEIYNNLYFLDVLYMMEYFNEFPFIFNINLIATKIKQFKNLNCRQVDVLFTFLKENKDDITGLQSQQICIFLYEILKKIKNQYNPLKYKELLVNTFNYILNINDFLKYKKNNNVKILLNDFKQKKYKEEEILKILSKNNYAIFIDFLMQNKLYKLNEIQNDFSNKVFFKWLESSKNIWDYRIKFNNILVILNLLKKDILKENLKLMIVDYIDKENELNYYLSIFVKDLKNKHFKNKLLKIIKNKNLNLDDFAKTYLKFLEKY